MSATPISIFNNISKALVCTIPYFILSMPCCAADAQVITNVAYIHYRLPRLEQTNASPSTISQAQYSVKPLPTNITHDNKYISYYADFAVEQISSDGLNSSNGSGTPAPAAPVEPSRVEATAETGQPSQASVSINDNSDIANNDERIASTNKRLEIAYQLLNLADLCETVRGLNSGQFSEANPLFGKHPSDAKLIAIKSLAGAIHFALYRAYKDDTKNTRIFEYVTVAIQGAAVIYNATISF